MKLIAIALISLVLSGCATAEKMNRVSVGMSKAEVIKQIGAPDWSEGGYSEENLAYVLPQNMGDMFKNTYVVVIKDGKVDSYHRVERPPMDPQVQAAFIQSYRPIQFQPQQLYIPPAQPRTINCMSNQIGNQTYTNCN